MLRAILVSMDCCLFLLVILRMTIWMMKRAGWLDWLCAGPPIPFPWYEVWLGNDVAVIFNESMNQL